MLQANAVHNLNRRSLLAGTAAVSAVAVSAFPALAFAPDPIFAVIERHRAAWLADANARMADDHHGEKIDRKADPRPCPLVHWRGYHIGGEELEDRRAVLIMNGEPPAVIEAEYQQYKAKWDANCAELKAWEDRNGVTPLKERAEATGGELDEAITALVDIQPTTMAGVLALLAYVWEFNTAGLAITKTWYSDPDLWPDSMSQDDVLTPLGRPVEMEFSHWLLRNVEQALRNITAAA